MLVALHNTTTTRWMVCGCVGVGGGGGGGGISLHSMDVHIDGW